MMGNTNTAIPLYRRKIDIQGNYAPFPGYTIVSHALHPLPKSLTDLYNYLSSSELKNYYSFLPISSYHVTMNPLENVRDELIPLLKEEQRKLKEQDTTSVCTVEKLVHEGVILIEVQFKEDQNPNFENHVKNVRSPELRQANVLHPYTHRWHLTMAYRYKDIENAEVKNRLDQILQNITSALPPFTIPLDHMRICHYDDMTKFTPI